MEQMLSHRGTKKLKDIEEPQVSDIHFIKTVIGFSVTFAGTA